MPYGLAANVGAGETVTYRTRDPIKNLRVRVTLRRVTAASSRTPAAAASAVESAEGIPMENMSPQSSSIRAATSSTGDPHRQAEEVRVVGWQEKVFSAAEEATYAAGIPQETILSRMYADQLKRERKERRAATRAAAAAAAAAAAEGRDSSENGQLVGRIFTYVDYDDFIDEGELSRSVTMGARRKDRPSFLLERMNKVRRRHGDRRKSHASRKTSDEFDWTNPVTYEPGAQERAKRVVSLPFQVMYILADLRPTGAAAIDSAAAADGSGSDGDGANDNPNHRVLCTLRVDSHGLLEVTPGFNAGRPPYRIETPHGEVYDVTLEHASADIAPVDAMREARMFSELYARHAELTSNRVGTSFEEPPSTPGSINLFVRGQLATATGFETCGTAARLYVNILRELPPGWQSAAGAEAQTETAGETSAVYWATTQMSGLTFRSHPDGLAAFAYPIEFSCLCPPPPLPPDAVSEESGGGGGGDIVAADPSLDAPILYFQVCSLDSWECNRVEGYGHITLPRKPGTYKFDVATWRPLGRDPSAELRRFFIGAAPELEDETYVGIPPGHSGPVLSKYGLRTQSTGTLQVSLHIAHQCAPKAGAEAAEAAARAAEAALPMRVNPAALSKSTAAVLAAFNRAHARMKRLGDISERERVAIGTARQSSTSTL